MKNEIILTQIKDIMLLVFDLDELTISDSTTASDIEDWDSLSHMRLVVSIEKKFGIRLSTAEIESFDTVGAMVRAIAAKTA